METYFNGTSRKHVVSRGAQWSEGNVNLVINEDRWFSIVKVDTSRKSSIRSGPPEVVVIKQNKAAYNKLTRGGYFSYMQVQR